MGLDGHRPRQRLRRLQLPTRLCLWWDHLKCGPTMDTNGQADGADVGSARWGLCSCTLLPVTDMLKVLVFTELLTRKYSII